MTLLTDDEVVALSVAAEQPWPEPLVSVLPDADAQNRAAFRGFRSLVVRGLASRDVERFSIDPHLLGMLSAVGQAKSRTVLYIATESAPEQVSGESWYFFAGQAASNVVVDSVSTSGIHDLQLITPTAATDLATAIQRKVTAEGISSDSPAILVAASSAVADRVLVTSRGRVQAASFPQGAGEPLHFESTSSNDADDSLVRSFVEFH